MAVGLWFLSMCAFSLLQSTLGDHVGMCSDHVPSNSTCNCSDHSSSFYDLFCPNNLTAQIKINESVRVQCFSFDPQIYSLLAGWQVGHTHDLVLRLCPLPETSVRQLMDVLGINSLETLRIQSYSSFNDTLKRRHFEKLSTVTTLSLSNNGLTSLPGNLFEDMSSLTWLDMKYNHFVGLPREIFNFTPKLQVLELGMNELTYLEPGIFKGLNQLRLLNLWSNKLGSNLTRAVFSDITNLESLDLNTNQIESLRPDLFVDLVKMSKLNLFGNKFASFPQGILAGNINLEEFQMHENKRSIISLPPGFLSNLNKLKMVRLSNSKIMSLYEDTFIGSKNILKLYINSNDLRSLPKGIFADQENLEELDLSVNSLANLTDELFVNMRRLKVLKLNLNNIMHVPLKLFSNLGQLEYLDLRFNKIKEITHNQFDDLKSLKTLNISDNQLTSLALELEGGYPVQDSYGTYSVTKNNLELVDLQLANNSLTEIYMDWRLVLIKLRNLNLSFNKFKFLDIDYLEFTGDVSVDISNNNIEWIDFWNAKLVANGALDGFNSSYLRDQQTRQKTVILDDNPFICDCKMFRFVEYIQGGLSPEVQYLYKMPSENLKCKQPKNLENVSLKYLSLSLLTCEFTPGDFTNTNSPNVVSYKCPDNCSCMYRPFDHGNLINCQYTGLVSLPSSLPTYKLANHTELYLEGNLLQIVNIPDSRGYENITHLYLADNNITTINITSATSHLKVLDVSNNKLASLSAESIKVLENAVYLDSLLLNGNPWQCGCNTMDFIRLLKNKYVQVKNLLNVTCTDGRSLVKLDEVTLCQQSATLLVLAHAFAITALLVAILTILYYRYQTEIHIYCFSSNWQLLRWLVSHPDLDENKGYDAFVSYAFEDEKFVTEYLVPYLEGKGETNFKLCLHYRDWIPGESIPIQIINSVKSSRRTIVVLSPNFLNSVWGKMEFKTAHQQALEDGQTRVIPILYKDVGHISELDDELKTYLQMNTYVKWGSPWFWQQLTYALPHPNAKDMGCTLCCFPRNRGYNTQMNLQSVQINESVLHCVSDKTEKTNEMDKVVITTPNPDKKPTPLIIEDVDSKSKQLPSDNYNNGKIAVCT